MTIYWGDGTSTSTHPSGGKILDWAQGTSTGTTSTNSTSWNDTGISASLTVASGKKVLVQSMMTVAANSTMFLRLMRGGTAIALGASASSKQPCTWGAYSGAASGSGGSFYYGICPVNLQWIDDPGAGTHAYHVEWRVSASSITMYRGRSYYDGNTHYNYRTPCHLVALEID